MATSKKDYIAVAKVIKKQTDNWEPAMPVLTEVARGIADVFASDNALFDRERFLAACGVD